MDRSGVMTWEAYKESLLETLNSLPPLKIIGDPPSVEIKGRVFDLLSDSDDSVRVAMTTEHESKSKKVSGC
jgi:hypothetical protein